MSTSLSNFVDKLSGVKIQNVRDAWKEKNRLNSEFIGFKNGRLNYKCKECKKSHTKLTNESIKNFPTLYKFYNGDLDKFFSAVKKRYLSL